MTERNVGKLNWVERHLPEGLVVDAAWLTRHGYSTSLRSQYVAAGWLEQPARGTYRRTRGSLTWQQVVISLQTLLGQSLTVGGRTALELQGFAHYLPRETKEVHLYGPAHPPRWLNNLDLNTCFHYHNDLKLFRQDLAAPTLPGLDWNVAKDEQTNKALLASNLVVQPWGQWDWPLTLSTPERAVFELLDELPNHESFHQVDMLIEGMANLSPRRLQTLLKACRNVKVKRLFFFFADRHPHAWLKRLDKHTVDLGHGKRMLVKGGKLNKAYQITVPEDVDAIQ
jgi:Transcriptional regulator, AbiEi antitoxin, Type IV TA system/Transcriptional regulator, AbiEi antitoxin N-terminal domain